MLVLRLFPFLLLNLLILYAWYRLLSRDEPLFSVAILIVGVMSVAQIILTTLFIGLALKALTPANLAVLNAAISVALIGVAHRRRPRSTFWTDSRASLQRIISIGRSDLILKILAALTAATILWIVFLGVIYPPIEWDSLMYHLPATAYYMQQRSLADPLLPMSAFSKHGIDGAVWIAAFPKNIELLFLWTTMLVGEDTVTDLVELAFGLLGIVAVYVLARRLGVSSQWSLTAGLLFWLTPITLAQSRSGLIDLSNSALILTAFALLYAPKGTKPLEIGAAGAAAGIVLGAKWSGILFLVMLWLFLAVQRLHQNRTAYLRLWANLLRDSALFIGPALVLGSYWYLKNLYLYGNPLWPFPIKILGLTLFPGVIGQNEVLAAVFPKQLQDLGMLAGLWTTWREPLVYTYDYDMRLGGLGPVWFIFALPSLAYLIWRTLKRRDVRLMALIGTLAAMLILHPENWWTRYTMFLAGIGAIALVMVRSRMEQIKTTRLIDIMLVAIVVYSTLASFVPHYYLPKKIAAVLSTPQALRTSGMIRPEIVSRAYDYISLRTLKSPANIAYSSGVRFTYPLWGTGLQNQVHYVRAKSSSRWQKRLLNKRIKYLLVSTKSPEFRFIKGRPAFKKSFFDRKWGYAVYEFRGETSKR